MDLIILLAVFVAFLALAYVTYRNVYNLDSRLRKIEDILKNAQVVAEPMGHAESPQETSSPPPANEAGQSQQSASLPNSVPQEPSPYAGRYGVVGGDSFEGPISGWGGEGGGVPPKVTVAKEGADTRAIEIIPDDADNNGSDDEVEVDDILNEMEHGDDDESSSVPDLASVKVADLRKALKDSNVTIPSGAKKADLIRLVRENGISVHNDDTGDDDNGDGDNDNDV